MSGPAPGTCPACNREPCVKDSKWCFSCKMRIDAADSRAANLKYIHEDMESVGIPVRFTFSSNWRDRARIASDF